MRKVYSFFKTQKFTTLLISSVLMVISINEVSAQANAGVWDSYTRLGGKDYFLGYSSTPPAVFTSFINQRNAPALNATNLGTFSSTATLNLQGGLTFSWKPTICCTGNICGAWLNYSVYDTGFKGIPTFSSQQLNNNGSGGNKGSYYWQTYFDTTSLNTNILAGLQPGTYYLDIWISETGSETGNDCNSTISVNGLPSAAAKADYKAIFTIKGPKCPAPAATGTELIVNGDFSAGNSGFTSGYTYTTPSGNSQPDQYYVGNATQAIAWNNSFVTSGSPNGGNGNFMIVDGNGTPAGLNVWSETVNVIPNTTYIFSFYACSFGSAAPASLYFYANNTPFGGGASAPASLNNWTKVSKAWCSGSNTTVTIMIQDSNTVHIGNDFGLDSLSLRASTSYSNITAGDDTTVCSGNPAQLHASFGACTYNWTPSAGLDNDSIATPVATPTVTTTYTLIAAVPGCTDISDTSQVVVNISGTGGVLNVTASPDSICIGQKSTLAVAGGSGVYQWSPGLTDSTKAIIIVSPTVTTSYTVTKGSGNCASAGQVTVTVSSGTGGNLIVTANPDSICPGATSTLSVTGGSGSYVWSASGLTTATSSTINVTPAITTVYTAKAPGGGACAAQGTVTLTVSNNTKGGKVSTTRDTLCEGTTGNLSLTGNSSNVIQWQSSGNNTTYTSITGATSSTYKTLPLQQSAWYHAVVGSGFCTATSDSLLLYVPPALIASFYSTQAGGRQLNFNSDSSAGAIRSYHWDFGDGQTSTDKNPSHTFAKDSTYYVCLTLYDGSNCSYTYCRYSSITDAVPTIEAAGSWVIYPNPLTNQLTISAKQTNSRLQSVELYDVLGQMVVTKNMDGITNTTLQLDVSPLAKGMYFVMIRTTNAGYVQKVIKQ